MLVLPKRDLKDTFWADSIAIPAVKHVFEAVTDQCPEEVENVYILYKDSILSTIEIAIRNNWYETSFIMSQFWLERIKKILNVREGSCYV